MKRTTHTFDELSDLNYSIESLECEERPIRIVGDSQSPLTVLLVSFAGQYSDGDSTFMVGVIDWAIHAWESCGLILDFRALDYDWGDRMENVINAGFATYGVAEHTLAQIFTPNHPPTFPTAVLVSDLCSDGLASLIRDEMQGYDGVVVQTEEEALDYIRGQWDAQH